MLTSDQTKLRFKILIILASIAVASIIASAVIIFVAQLYGFSVASPFTCTITYFRTKFTSQNAFLTASFITVIIAAIAGLAFLIALIVILVRLSKTEEESVNKTADGQIVMLYIFLSVGMMSTVIPLGYFGSIIIQATSQCSASTATDWLIIVGTAALAEIVFIVSWAILLDLRIKLEDGQAIVEKQIEKSASVKSEKIEKDIEGEIIVKENDQKLPLLEKGQGQQTHIVPEAQNQKKTQHQQPRKSRFLSPEPEPTLNKKPSSSKFSQTSKISEKSSYEKQRQPPKHIPPPVIRQSKEQAKPDASTQNVTHINFNFPSSFPQVGQPQIPPIVITTPMNSSKSANSLNRKPGKKQKNENRSIIKQSMEEELSSDSDDRYYKRARKNKKRKFDHEEGEKQGRLNKRRKEYERQYDYERQFDRIPSRFQGSPSEPRYVVLSPESLKTFYEFVKHEGQSLTKGRNFATPDLSSEEKAQNPLKMATVGPSNQKTPQTAREEITRVESPEGPYYTSMVKEFGQELLQPETLKRQQVKQASFYERLNGHEDSQDDLKRYQRFFKSSRQLHIKQTGSEKNSSLYEYFNLLNSRAENKQSSTVPNHNEANYHTQNYNSLSNYSSVLNEQKGKIPTERQHHSIRKIKVEKNMNEPPSKKKSIIEQIRNKYN